MSQRKLGAVGIVKWFSRLKGFGFIEPDDENEDDIFVHYSAIQDEPSAVLCEGDRVRYDVVEGSSGLTARNVRKV